MGLYDTMQQVATPQTGAVNGTSAQKQPLQNAWQQKQQQRANPIMQGRPAMQNNMQKPNNNMASVAGGLMNAYQNRPTPTAGQIPGGMGSRTQMQNKQQMLKNQTAAAEGGGIGGSYNQLIQAHPGLADMRNTGMQAGQDMSWMDKPGALQLPANYGKPDVMREDQVQSGIANLQTPYDQQQSAQPIQEVNPMQAAAEQMRGYEGPDLGSQDPRELARVSGGIGPSNPMQQVQMDENGLEPRRGAR